MSQTFNRREAFGTLAALATPFWANAADNILTARAFDPAGKPAGPRQLDSLLLIDPDGRPFELLPKVQGDGVVHIEMPKTKFQLMMRLPVRDFGEVYLYADDVKGPEAVLNYDFARSRAAFVRRYITAAQQEGVSFSAELTKRLEAGEAALKQATAAKDIAERVRHANDSLADTMPAGEMAALERARYRIHRNGARPGFLFGANLFGFAGAEQYRQAFTGLLNFGTVPLYRNNTERVEGVLDYSRAQAIVDRAAAANLLMKGHPLVWLKAANMPAFLPKKSWPDAKTSCRDYILNTVGRFRSRIHVWDVINEAHDWANEMKYDPQQLTELTELASQTTRIADPTAFRVVNNCCLWGEYVATRTTNSTPIDRPCRTPLEYLKALRDAKVDYDAIGLQIYCPGRDMLEIERHIERFAALGKPLHITELGTPAANTKATTSTYEERGRTIPYPIDAVWHGTEWSEQIQADWAEQFYTICYAMPQLEAITWWDFSDPGYMPNGGFVTREFKPKECYNRLQKVIAGWRA